MPMVSVGAKIAQAAVILSLIGGGAHAQSVCGTKAPIMKRLNEVYHEAIVSRSILAGGAAKMEVYASPGGKTFSVLVVYGNGVACLVASGTDYHAEKTAAGDGI
jgi:hypothetical protein